MCNACNNHCCGSDEFGGCGCDHCDCPDCWSDDEDEFDDGGDFYDFDPDNDTWPPIPPAIDPMSEDQRRALADVLRDALRRQQEA